MVVGRKVRNSKKETVGPLFDDVCLALLWHWAYIANIVVNTCMFVICRRMDGVVPSIRGGHSDQD